MKAYLMTTGAVFGLVTLTHLWRIYEEGRSWRRILGSFC
jgi:hypothetical protein